MSTRPRLVHRLLRALSIAAVAWGALAFGAVYPWAFTPLAVVATIVGAGALIVERHGRPGLSLLALAFVAVGAAIAVQLVPLPLGMLARLSPAAEPFLRGYDLSFQVALQQHPLSIAPDKTVRGLLLFAAIAMFVLGLSRLISVVGARAMAGPIVGFGAILALIGIVQNPFTENAERPLIYGLWKPVYYSHPFGPFVNPNHFAGWMVMALPLALAVFCDVLLLTFRSAPHTRSGRIELVSSPQFGALLATGIASLLMGLSLFMTHSRSGLAAASLGALLVGASVARRQKSGRARVAVMASAACLLLGAAMWAGTDTLLAKFVESSGQNSFSNRVSAWKDTVTIIRRFPLTGSGLDSYGTAMLQYQSNTHLPRFVEAHNDYLQLAAEGGLLVGIPVLLALLLFVREVGRRFREAPKDGSTYWIRVGAVIGLVCIAAQSLVEFSLQMPGNALLFGVLAAIALHQSPNLPPAPSSRPVR